MKSGELHRDDIDDTVRRAAKAQSFYTDPVCCHLCLFSSFLLCLNELTHSLTHSTTVSVQLWFGASSFHHILCFLFQGETKVLKLKNLRPKDFADYTCQVSVRNVCTIEDKSVTFRLTNATSMLVLFLS